ncbi:Alpha/Beta hydrolase protein [Lineolata rhizophorae]|uniref:Alpha/Beta hydrolase protein n=1 Tax=Lineolata rhizophorae TaxID=578093 RepID=A0A6A6NLW0_9PEZI|nr:Alpha/Beta hydrolase protein [Lineolata rhizophorae]
MPSANQFSLPDGRLMSYELSPKSDEYSPTVLLSNSLCASFTTWDHVVPVLHNRGFRVLRYDQPGHGSSSPPANPESTTFESIADDVYSLLSNLGITSLYAWIGVSMGAATGIVFVTRNPGVVKNLVICDTISCAPVVAGVENLFAPRVEIARREGNLDSIVEQTLARWFAEPWMEVNSAETERMRAAMRKTSVEGFAACCNALTLTSFDLRALTPKVGSSVDRAMLVVGERDANLPQSMAELRDQIRQGFVSAGKEGVNVELKIIKGAGHVPYVDGFDQFCEIVTEFLQEI